MKSNFDPLQRSLELSLAELEKETKKLSDAVALYTSAVDRHLKIEARYLKFKRI